MCLSFSLLREDPLPDGWEMKVSDGGVIYFVNHNTKEQTYRDPRGKELKWLATGLLFVLTVLQTEDLSISDLCLPGLGKEFNMHAS